MDARSVVDAHLDGQKLLEHYDFDNIDASRTTIRACCKIHGGDNPHGFTYDTETNMWHCHTGECGGGDAYELIKRFEGLSYPSCVMRMAEILHVDVEGLQLSVVHSKKEKDEWLELVKKRKNAITLKPYAIPDLDVKQLKKLRNFTPETLLHFSAMYIESFPIQKEEGKVYTLHNRIIIPIHFNKMFVGVALRRTRTEDILKWSLQGFETGQVLYNYDNCVKYLNENVDCDEVILCEGCFDVWSFWQQGIYNVVATFGAHITAKQIELLQGICTTLVLAYDNDTAGQKNTRKAIGTLRSKFGVYVIAFDNGQDPGETSDLQIRYKNKIKHTKWGD